MFFFFSSYSFFSYSTKLLNASPVRFRLEALIKLGSIRWLEAGLFDVLTLIFRDGCMLRPLFWLDKREFPFGGPLWISFSTNWFISALKPASQNISCGLRPALLTDLSNCYMGILYWAREVLRTSLTISPKEFLNIKWIAVFPNASCSVKIVSSGISLLGVSLFGFSTEKGSPLAS